MKHIFYLNTDLLDSYISQVDGGIVSQKQIGELNQGESTITEEVLKELEKGFNLRGETGILSDISFLPRADGSYNQLNTKQSKVGSIETKADTDSELLTLIYHDYALNKLETHLSDDHLVKDSDNIQLND